MSCPLCYSRAASCFHPLQVTISCNYESLGVLNPAIATSPVAALEPISIEAVRLDLPKYPYFLENRDCGPPSDQNIKNPISLDNFTIIIYNTLRNMVSLKNIN